ncbi:MAG: alpha/beta hydrolase fold domain-containing protein [Roseibium sp.]|nr:alpha/beta hydrolase fold domain-containing protein [Roseibium sp.]
MASSISRTIRKEIVREEIRPDRSLYAERSEWENAMRDAALPEGCAEREDYLAGVKCLWLLPDEFKSEELVIYAHGGGLVTGAISTHRPFCAQLAVALGRRVLLVGYRRLPEHAFNAPRDDFLSVYYHLIDTDFCTPDDVVFAGDSSGGTVTFSALVRLRQQMRPLPSATVCFSGAFDTSLSGESLQNRADLDPLLSPEVLMDWQKHFRDRIELTDPLISPLFADLHGLPPTLLLAGDHELWLSDSIRMHEALGSHGSPSRLSVYPEMWHVWPMWPELPETRDAMKEVDQFLEEIEMPATT